MTVVADQGTVTKIGLTRFFTDGVTPVEDMFSWEHRDVSLKQGEKVVFEQLGVEVPSHFNDNATKVLAQKYFFGALGTPEREWSFKQTVGRIVRVIANAAIEYGYMGQEELAVFIDELKFLLYDSRMAFNSPVWFNVGCPDRPPVVSACYITPVPDNMEAILQWIKNEGLIFKGGSGNGSNISTIRSKKERLSNSDNAPSGPVSFMRGADTNAGMIKSGGKSRRAAKMVILDASHPDIEEFVWCKAVEEKKARALIDAGFDASMNGEASFNVQFQNANNTVRISDELMNAYVDDGDFELRAVTTGEVMQVMKARDLVHQIAAAAWECGDPGVQFQGPIDLYHTVPNSGPQRGSNPCFPGEALVHTDKGLVRFADLFQRAGAGERFGIYTHDITNVVHPDAGEVVLSTHTAVAATGLNEIVALRFSNGAELRSTPNHAIWTTNRGWVEARDLTSDDRVRTLDLPTPAHMASWALPVSSETADYSKIRYGHSPVALPVKWSTDLAGYMGWLVGDGCISKSSTQEVAICVYGSDHEVAEVMPRHQEFLASIYPATAYQVRRMGNGTTQLWSHRTPFVRFLGALGVSGGRAPQKSVPWSIFVAPDEVQVAFLRGLFDSDGSVTEGGKYRHVSLGSSSHELLVDVQRLLSAQGIISCIYETRSKRPVPSLNYTKNDGTYVEYASAQMYDLRISAQAMSVFAARVGFGLSGKAESLWKVLTEHEQYRTDTTVSMVSRQDDGVEVTYNLTEPRNHSYIVNGVVVRNCSEFIHLDNSSCDLASLRMTKFRRPGPGRQGLDVEAFKHAVQVTAVALEILISLAEYPTEAISEVTRKHRPIGLGYGDIGAYLMLEGLPYETDGVETWDAEGNQEFAAITSLMCAEAYKTSAQMAAVVGPYEAFGLNRQPHLSVLRRHQVMSHDKLDPTLANRATVQAANAAWDEAVELAEAHGLRNSQSTVTAPTGCLVAGTLVPTSRGLVRLGSLGNPDGAPWQDLAVQVATDEGAKDATKFFVNGLSEVVRVETNKGFTLRGTPRHQVKIVNPMTGEWDWEHFANLKAGQVVPIALGTMTGQPQRVPLPPLGEASWTCDHTTVAPREMTPELAELVGYFMGDGSLHSKGLRLCVANEDIDVVERLLHLGKSCFGLAGQVEEKRGYKSVNLTSVRLILWWEACGFVKHSPSDGHWGKSYEAHVPDAILASNNAQVYAAFLRGLFEADGTISRGAPHLRIKDDGCLRDVQAMLAHLGIAASHREIPARQDSWGKKPQVSVRVFGGLHVCRFVEMIGFMGGRKKSTLRRTLQEKAHGDLIYLPTALFDKLVPFSSTHRKHYKYQVTQGGAITREMACALYEETDDKELAHYLKFFYVKVESVGLDGEDFTYDLSVPENVTYIANGFISHNTIGILLSFDTYSGEPGLSEVGYKTLAGGGYMTMVMDVIDPALKNLGYAAAERKTIMEYVLAHGGLKDREDGRLAPGFKPEHLGVFKTAIGSVPISPMGHIRILECAAPWISGSVSKTVNLPKDCTVEDIEHVYVEAWKRGIKCVAVFRDGCKTFQPVVTSERQRDEQNAGGKASSAEVDRMRKQIEALRSEVESHAEMVKRPVRERLPEERLAANIKFQVADLEGYLTVGEYPDGRPGEIFIRTSKQGSTLSGIMDGFAIAVSLGLQYGVPLSSYVKKFMGMRFEPAGITNNADVRVATSILDHLFRRMAIKYLPMEERTELGVLTREEKIGLASGGHTNTIPVVDLVAASVAPALKAPEMTGDLSTCCGAPLTPVGTCKICSVCFTSTGCS